MSVDHPVLSVRQPWAWAIMHSGKDVENRSWRTTYRGPLWIQAGMTLEREAIDQLRADGFAVPGILPRGAVIGRVTLVDCVRGHTGRWAEVGARHWLLSDPLPLSTPVSLSGKLNLFRLTPQALEVLQRLAAT